MKKTIFIGEKEDKVIVQELVKEIYKYLLKIKGYVTISIKKETERSLQQNKYYWAILEIAGKEYGITKDDLHLFFKYKYLVVPTFRLAHREIREITLNEIESLKQNEIFISLINRFTTTKLTVQEFNEYIEQVKGYIEENICFIPDYEEYFITRKRRSNEY